MAFDLYTSLPVHVVEAALQFKFGGVWRVSIERSSATGVPVGSITHVHENGSWSSVQFAIPMGTSPSGSDVLNLFRAKAAEIVLADQSNGKLVPAPMSLTARALTERPQWNWAEAAGMGVVLDEAGRTITGRVGEVNDSGDALREAGWQPDLTDWATIGILLGWCQRVKKTSLTAPLVDIWTAEAGGYKESAQSPGLAVAILLLTLWDSEEGK